MALLKSFDELCAAQHDLFGHMKSDFRRQFTVAIKDGIQLDPSKPKALSDSSLRTMHREQQSHQVAEELATLQEEVARGLDEVQALEAEINAERAELEAIQSSTQEASHQLLMAREIIFKDDDLKAELFAKAESAATELNKHKHDDDEDDDVLFQLPREHRKLDLGNAHTQKRTKLQSDGGESEQETSPATPPQTPPHTPSSAPRSPVVHAATAEGPIRPRRHFFEAHTTRLPALAAARCPVCTKSISFAAKTVKCTQCARCFHTSCMGGIPIDCRPPPYGTEAAKKRKLPPFGCNLLKAIDTFSSSGRVPAIVEDAIAAMDRRGLSIEGIYRVPVDESEAQQLSDHFFDGSKRPNLMTVANVHLVAAAFLAYLRNLDEPLLTVALYGRFLSAAEEDENDPGIFERLCVRLLALPPVNFHVTMALALHLQRVVMNAEQNKMGMDAICNLFVPVFLASPSGPEADEADNSMQLKVLRLIISLRESEWNKLFGEFMERGPISFVHSPDPPEKLLKKATPKKEEEPC